MPSALPTPNYYCANKRANDSQVRTLAVNVNLDGFSSFTTEASLGQANTIKTLNQKFEILLKKSFNTTADSSKSETLTDKLTIDCKL